MFRELVISGAISQPFTSHLHSLKLIVSTLGWCTRQFWADVASGATLAFHFHIGVCLSTVQSLHTLSLTNSLRLQKPSTMSEGEREDPLKRGSWLLRCAVEVSPCLCSLHLVEDYQAPSMSLFCVFALRILDWKSIHTPHYWFWKILSLLLSACHSWGQTVSFFPLFYFLVLFCLCLACCRKETCINFNDHIIWY